jgi:hypothetical protein
MHNPRKLLLTPAFAAVVLLTTFAHGQPAADKDKEVLPPQLTKEQRENLQRFLEKHERPDRFLPPDAKVVSAQPSSVEVKDESKPGQPVKQYMVQITPHRPVPGQEEVKNVDVYYYRPNPEKGKPGITVRHTVDVTTGKQVGQTEVLLNHHTPISRDELAEAVALAREKSPAVGELYKDRDKDAVRWEYLQLMVNRKHEPHEPGDRVVRFVFTAAALGDQAPPVPVRVIVNLTKGVAVPEAD